MVFRKFPRVVAAATGALGVALTMQVFEKVWGGVDAVTFPNNYATGVMYLSIYKTEGSEVRQLYAMPDALAAARRNEPMPSGTVLTLVRYVAKLDGQGRPVKGADGQFVRGKLLGYSVMEKRTGWGNQYPDAVRNGEWEYRAFTAEKRPNESADVKACFECHKSVASQDFVYSYDALKSTVR